MELSARKEIRVRIAGAAIWVAAAILTLSLLLPAFFSAGLWTPSRISARVSSTDVTFHYSSDEKTVRITSNSEESNDLSSLTSRVYSYTVSLLSYIFALVRVKPSPSLASLIAVNIGWVREVSTLIIGILPFVQPIS